MNLMVGTPRRSASGSDYGADIVTVRTTEYVLKKFKGKPPSLILHLHPTHFRFDQQDGSFGYTSPMRFLLEHIKAQTVPHDMLEELFQSGVPFYDGKYCLGWTHKLS